MARCICLDNVPVIGIKRLRPNPACPLHKTLAERWVSIKTQEQFDAALEADRKTLRK